MTTVERDDNRSLSQKRFKLTTTPGCNMLRGMTTTSSNGGGYNNPEKQQIRRKSRPGSAKSNRSTSQNRKSSITKITLNK